MTQTTLSTTDKEKYEIADFSVSKIDQRSACLFVSQHHYAGGMGNAAIPFGLFDNPTSKLMGVIAFHAPISENVRASVFGEDHKDSVIELHRMAIHPDAPHNTATWFISRALDALKEHKPKYKAVISMADTTEGHDGTVYQAANADYYGTTGKATFYRDGMDRLRAPRQCGENITPAEAEERGWKVEKREAKHRYVFWLPDEYESKSELRSISQIEFQEYPDR
jgi:hypothetical protein